MLYDIWYYIVDRKKRFIALGVIVVFFIVCLIIRAINMKKLDKEFETLQSANEYAFKMVKDYLKRHSKEK